MGSIWYSRFGSSSSILVGTDIAAVLALTFGSNRTHVISWMTVSLAVWTVILQLLRCMDLAFKYYLGYHSDFR